MVLPLVPLAVSAGGAAVAGVSGWAFVQYDKLTTQFAQQQAQLHQLQLSAESVQTRTLWSELLEPVAKRWGGALKLIAYSLCAVSGTIIVVGLGRARQGGSITGGEVLTGALPRERRRVVRDAMPPRRQPGPARAIAAPMNQQRL